MSEPKSVTKPFHKRTFKKSVDESIVPTNPNSEGPVGHPHYRYHPLRQEWVSFASHRQNRTFLPPKDYSPLLETR